MDTIVRATRVQPVCSSPQWEINSTCVQDDSGLHSSSKARASGDKRKGGTEEENGEEVRM